MTLLRHLPNALTICNLLCGCIGIILASSSTGNVAYWVWAACVFDFLDGFAARALKVSSPIGKELDSLADMVTFGVLPAIFMYHILPEFSFIALVIAVCSALRLAIFNTDTRQTDGFIGVPTPASALFFVNLPAALAYFNVQPNLYLLMGVILLFSWLMVSPLRLFALKFKTFGWKGNELKFTFLIVSGLLIAVFKDAGVPLVILTYIVASLISGLTKPSH